MTDLAIARPDRLAPAVDGLEPESAIALRAAFISMFDSADEWIARASAIHVTDVAQKREMKFARESRLALRELRVAADKKRKSLKEDSLRRGRAIDGLYAVFVALVAPIEAHLLEQETYAERTEAARRSVLREERASHLRALGADPVLYTDLGALADEAWASALTAAQEAAEARAEAARRADAVRVEAERIERERREAEAAERARCEAERIETARIAEAVRADREAAIAAENERLRAVAASRETAAQIERTRIAAEREAERAERDRLEVEARKQRETAAQIERELAAERKHAQDAEDDRVAAIEAAEATRLAAIEAAALAPDRDKLLACAVALRAVPVPALATKRGRTAGDRVAEQIAKLAGWIEKSARSL